MENCDFRERERVKYFWFLDHDILPVKKTSILHYLKKQKMYWYLLDKEKLEYARNARTIRPWFCFFDKSLSKKFDFRPTKSLFPLYALDTWGKNYRLIFRKYDKNKLEFASRELIWVHDVLSEESLNYNDISNYSWADNFIKKKKILYTYEYLKNNEWIHRSSTYFLNNWNMEYKHYENLLKLFYDKLNILLK